MAHSKYHIWCEKNGLESVRRLAEDGLSDAEIADRINVTFSDFMSWKRRFSDFREAIRMGRSEADFSVVEAIYKKATGYKISTSKTHKLKRIDYDPDTGKKLREYEELAVGVDEDHIPPDLRAGIFWLKNRQPDKWNEKSFVPDVFEGGIVELPSADTIDRPPFDSDNGEI